LPARRQTLHLTVLGEHRRAGDARADSVDTATIDPPEPGSIIARATARMVSHAPVRLISMIRRQSAGA
jgi:hypothetical protein